MVRKLVCLMGILSLASIAYMATASSPDAWEELRKDIKLKCEKKLQNTLVNPEITVDPFGVSSAGIALAAGKSKYSKDKLLIVCVYDKETGEVELGSELKLTDIPFYKKLSDENEQLRKEISELRNKMTKTQ
ncbi:hypothetical protein QUF72_07875 [Desulfobacterales bacterium HSG2]|nr:hypothetical protein [Desulfobacterales bacterium HSG2]